jgi:hypothetical protein
MSPTSDPLVLRVRCAPKKAPCPRCGTPARRKRTLRRQVRTIAYQRIAWLDITYGEYKACCGCGKSFRTSPDGVLPRAAYDNKVRQAVLDRIVEDGLNVERTRAALRRDFLLELSQGFVYDCLRWQVAQLDLAPHRQEVLARFSGTLCVDELHLGAYTLLLATDPLADLPVAFALVATNDQDHMRRFLNNLKAWGLSPAVVVTDGSGLYPAVLAELWPRAHHQLCVFHLLQDLNDKVLEAVRRLRRALARRGNAGRKRRRGRAARRGGPTAKDKAAFVFRHRHLVVKRTEVLSRPEWDDLNRMFDYLPELQVLWRFACDARALFAPGQTPQWAWRRRAALLREAAYQEVPELVRAMGLLCEEKFAKAVAFVYSPAGQKVRTNNHVERANRRLRFAEKVRYKWRRRRWVVRYVVLALDRWWQQAGRAAGAAAPAAAARSNAASPGGGRKNGSPEPRRRAAG